MHNNALKKVGGVKIWEISPHPKNPKTRQILPEPEQNPTSDTRTRPEPEWVTPEPDPDFWHPNTSLTQSKGLW